MKIQIWSDVACPFCYIGKRHLEEALKQTGLSEEVEVEWKSFQLDPDAPDSDERSIYQILAEKYNQSEQWARQMNTNMEAMAEKAGLHYHMDSLKPANTFDAHRLIHLAKEHGLQTPMKERLFSAYFTEGKHLGNSETLINLAKEVGLEEAEVREVVESDAFTSVVTEDINLAHRYGVQGVPFFLINEKYGISGAQPVESFKQALAQIREETELRS